MRGLLYISSDIGEDNILWGMLELSIDAVRSELVVDLNKTDPEQAEKIAEESAGFDFVITRDFSVNVANFSSTFLEYMSTASDSNSICDFPKRLRITIGKMVSKSIK